jgi:phosphinothricin acetyltransferase
MPTFRKLKPKDKKEVENIFVQLTGNRVKINTNSLIKDKGVNCLILEESGNIIGFGSLIIHQVPSEGFIARIEDVIILDTHRGKGYGRKILEELIRIAKKKKVKKINLTSNPKRIEARNLYSSMGFELYETGVFRMKIE